MSATHMALSLRFQEDDYSREYEGLMHIAYAGHVLQACPECHYQSVHFFNDVLMCILCGWERKRREGSRPCAGPKPELELQMPVLPRGGKRARQRARKAAMAKKNAKGLEETS